MLEEDISDNLLDILEDLEEQIELITSSGKNIDAVIQDNIIFTTTNVSPQTTSELGFALTNDNSDDTNEDNGFSDVNVGLKNDTQPNENDVRTSISLPVTIFQESNSK